MRPHVLVLPGLGDSGPEHWQTLWEQKEPAFTRVQQRDWERPRLVDWLAALREAIAARAGAPVVLVAHSLACALVAHAARATWGGGAIRGALLVAPADVDSIANTPPETRDFAPMPIEPLPFRAIVVASADDPYVSLERAAYFASQWRARLEPAGARGHLNSASGLGEWAEGRRLLDELIAHAGAVSIA